MCFKLNTSYAFYMKKAFEVEPFCCNRFNGSNSNLISRLQITMADAINSKVTLPQYILILLDNDIIDFLDFRGVGISSLIGQWIEWFLTQVHEMIIKRKERLPPKAKADDYPFVYIVELPRHGNFNTEENVARGKFKNCLQSVVKIFSEMRVVKLKEWNYDDMNLVVNNRFTTEGLAKYWASCRLHTEIQH